MDQHLLAVGWAGPEVEFELAGYVDGSENRAIILHWILLTLVVTTPVTERTLHVVGQVGNRWRVTSPVEVISPSRSAARTLNSLYSFGTR
ncbi:hypothetical protein [Indioceanicola profundi]|uniref:hypothetical protein n=1 Tax=Indioceanicola profundi TaxID=2220096 RepID=UPI000E6AA1A1|nr:hypothetical protein [Indioceanicola profundi]